MNENLGYYAAIILCMVPISAGCNDRATDRYRLGMTYEDIKALTDSRYELIPSPPSSLEYQKTVQRRDSLTTEEYYIVVQDEGVVLNFNHNKILISVVPMPKK